jgi:hypothetical protein
MYSILLRLTILPLGLAKLQCLIGHMDMYSSPSGAAKPQSNATNHCSIATRKRAMSRTATKLLDIAQNDSALNEIGKCAVWELS